MKTRKTLALEKLNFLTVLGNQADTVEPAEPPPMTTPKVTGADAPEEHGTKVMRCPRCGGIMRMDGELAPKQVCSP